MEISRSEETCPCRPRSSSCSVCRGRHGAGRSQDSVSGTLLSRLALVLYSVSESNANEKVLHVAGTKRPWLWQIVTVLLFVLFSVYMICANISSELQIVV